MMTLPLVDGDRRPNTTTVRDLDWYDFFLVSFSGGKDSIALALGLLRKGVARERTILMHQHVDGEPGVDQPFMDWPCTEGYCRAFAKATGLRLLFQWRHGGFLAAMAISNEPAFKGKRLLFLSGERRQESAARSRYAEMERHRTHTKSRHVDHWRMVIDWTEEEVWSIMRDFHVMPHPAYRLGWGRVSCLACIFGQADQWASVRLITPALFDRIARYERDFGRTIHKGRSVVDLADRGRPYPECSNRELVGLAMGRDYPSHLALTDDWTLPPGAFKHCGGPN